MQLRKALIALGIGTLTAVGLAIPAATTASATEPRPCDSQEHRTDKTCPPPKHRPPHKSKSPRPKESSKKPTKPAETSKKPTETATTTAPAKLPVTGDATSLPLLAGVGAGLVIVGGVLVGMRRRRDATEQ